MPDGSERTGDASDFATLARAWVAAYDQYGRANSPENYVREQDTWDAVIDYVEANGLTNTADDPRHVGYPPFAVRFPQEDA